jgi:hypothetical protein
MKTLLLTLVLSVPLSSFAADQPKIPAEQAACGDNAVKFNVKRDKNQSTPAKAPTGKATVYVVSQGAYLDGKNGKCGVVTRIGIDGHWVGANCENSYIVFPVEAGTHHLCGNWQTKVWYHPQPAALTSFDAKAGETYVFRARVYNDTSAPSPIDLKVVASDEASLLLASSSLSVSSTK